MRSPPNTAYTRPLREHQDCRGGSLRVFTCACPSWRSGPGRQSAGRQFSWLEVGSGKMALSPLRPPAGNASRWVAVWI